MKLFKKISLLLFIVLLIFVAHVLISTGFFRTVENHFEGEILQKISLSGAEDIMISSLDSFVLISATDRISPSSKVEEKGGLFLIDLKDKSFTLLPLTNHFKKPFAPHGISFFKKDSTYQVMAVNHTRQGHTIEVFELNDKTLTHISTLKHESMVQPNDLVMIDENRFYFTNDHQYTEGIGKLAEEYLGLAVSNVVYFDGKNYNDVADGIAYANGINYDKSRDLIFVASPRKFLVKVYTKNADGSLAFIEDIPCGTGVDNIEFDEEGNLWIGAHPNLLRFNAYAKGKKETAPSEIIKIDYRTKGDYILEKIYAEDGKEMSGSTVAATFGDLIFVGNVMDPNFLVLKRQK